MPNDTNTQPTDAALADCAAALMDCYNPPPLPAAAPVVNRWAEEAQPVTPAPLQTCYGG